MCWVNISYQHPVVSAWLPVGPHYYYWVFDIIQTKLCSPTLDTLVSTDFPAWLCVTSVMHCLMSPSGPRGFPPVLVNITGSLTPGYQARSGAAGHDGHNRDTESQCHGDNDQIMMINNPWWSYSWRTLGTNCIHFMKLSLDTPHISGDLSLMVVLRCWCGIW